MPVDAHIFATVTEAIPEAAIHALAADLAEALGPTRFTDYDRAGVMHQVAQEDYDGLPEGLPHAPCVLRVRLSSPFYGPEYERGSWPEIAAVLEFLRRRVPGARVWYGRDDGDWVREVAAESLDALWEHWAQHGGRPYYGKRSSAQPGAAPDGSGA